MAKYTDEDYENVIKGINKEWTKEETDHLWALCEEYDLRFIVIADRYNSGFNDTQETQNLTKKRDRKAKSKAVTKLNTKSRVWSDRTVDETKLEI